MYIVLIHWKIRHTQEGDFLKFWRTRVPINDDNKLIAEFLCAPFKGGFPYPVVPFDSSRKYISYVNVALWKDKASFLKQVGRYIPKRGSKLQPFEVFRRERIPLDPKHWRRGKFPLPLENSL